MVGCLALVALVGTGHCLGVWRSMWYGCMGQLGDGCTWGVWSSRFGMEVGLARVDAFMMPVAPLRRVARVLCLGLRPPSARGAGRWMQVAPLSRVALYFGLVGCTPHVAQFRAGATCWACGARVWACGLHGARGLCLCGQHPGARGVLRVANWISGACGACGAPVAPLKREALLFDTQCGVLIMDCWFLGARVIVGAGGSF